LQLPQVHRPVREERRNSTERGYDGRWRRFRKWFLSQPEHAICEDCIEFGLSPYQLSTEVHHVKKVADFPELRLVESNCRGSCKTCHSIRTARGE
jgi:5-methylcytosine-specific restriction protein A